MLEQKMIECFFAQLGYSKSGPAPQLGKNLEATGLHQVQHCNNAHMQVCSAETRVKAQKTPILSRSAQIHVVKVQSSESPAHTSDEHLQTSGTHLGCGKNANPPQSVILSNCLQNLYLKTLVHIWTLKK